jgi:hypothetical protein
MIMRKTKIVALVTAMFISLLTTLPAFGWGQEGHRIVGSIAEKYLNAKARAEVKRLLRGQSLADVANFADAWRIYHTNTAAWHFVDIPLYATSYDPQRDCVAHQGCILEQLEIFEKQLADPRESVSNRAFALKFVIHLVGDLHMPLHCEDNHDLGGNEVKVKFFGEAKKSKTSSSRWNLHSVWDVGLIQHTGLDETNYTQLLTAQLDAVTVQSLQTGTMLDWAMQSHSNAAQYAYKIPVDHDLGQAYFDLVKPALNASLLKGGLRLARVLNEALGQ